MDNTWTPSGPHVLKFFEGRWSGVGGEGFMDYWATYVPTHCVLEAFIAFSTFSHNHREREPCAQLVKQFARKFLWSVYRHFKMLRSQASLVGVVNICESAALAPDHRLAQGVSTSPDRLPKGYFNYKPPLTLEGITTNKALSLIVVEFCYPAKPNHNYEL